MQPKLQPDKEFWKLAAAGVDLPKKREVRCQGARHYLVERTAGIFANNAFATCGLEKACTFHFEDYRDTKGLYDGIASVEMIEAVGEAHWPAYFKTVFERLKPGGVAAIQGITIQEQNFDAYRNGVDFIQRYIFPGGMLLTKDIMREQAAEGRAAARKDGMFRAVLCRDAAAVARAV